MNAFHMFAQRLTEEEIVDGMSKRTGFEIVVGFIIACIIIGCILAALTFAFKNVASKPTTGRAFVAAFVVLSTIILVSYAARYIR